MVSSVQVAVKVPFHNAIASKDGTIVVFASTKNAYVLRVETGTVAALESKGHIRAMAYSETRRILACVTDSKELALFDVDSGTLVNTRQVWKRPNCVAFTQDSQKIVIGDKFGDVYSYHIDNVDIAATLLLGHVSIVTDFAWTNDFKQLITADRDEKLRVNRYPETFILDQFLLGHLEFVSRIVVVAGNDNVAISGGGDPFLMVWDCKTGQPKQKFDFVQALGGLPEGVQPCVTNLRYDQKNELVAVTLEK